jgi:CRISPR-associated endonuclease/helicase Cas3
MARTNTNTTFFDTAFRALTGNGPFPWQREFFSRLVAGEQPTACNIPTGLGKTAIIAIWLIGLAHSVKSNRAAKLIPRRLVYVVNRRTVVDQSTSEAEKVRSRLNGKGDLSNEDRAVLAELHSLLAQLCSTDHGEVLGISTLRGQFADNGQWRTDPARAAIIIGTVDMIGSRLLFSGYGIGFKSRPLHAGFLGQDTLLVHDEAHLEPAFQRLLVDIQNEQQRCKEFCSFQVMALTATSREQGEANHDSTFALTEEEKNPPAIIPDPPTKPIHHLWRRIRATKTIHLVPVADEKKELADKVADLALKFKDSKRPILVFARSVENVEKIANRLAKEGQPVLQLTGTLRGLERDQLVDNSTFQRFLPQAGPNEGTVYLVCTSAGEVGVNITADHLVCDLTTFESMAQRFGRVNRFGRSTDSEIQIVHPKTFEEDSYEQARHRTLELLHALDGDGSPLALGRLDPAARAAAFAPEPTILPRASKVRL